MGWLFLKGGRLGEELGNQRGEFGESSIRLFDNRLATPSPLVNSRTLVRISRSWVD